MTAEQIYQKWIDEYHLEGNNGGIQKHKSYILQMMQEYAKQMCDKQKQICSDNAELEGDEGDQVWIDKLSILNSPYPEELL